MLNYSIISKNMKNYAIFLCVGNEHPPAVCCGGQQRVCEGWQQEPASQAVPLGCRPGASME